MNMIFLLDFQNHQIFKGFLNSYIIGVLSY